MLLYGQYDSPTDAAFCRDDKQATVRPRVLMALANVSRVCGPRGRSTSFEPNTDPLRRMLLEFVAELPGRRAVEDLQQYTLLKTVYRPAQVISLIEKMRDDKVVATEPRRVTKKTQVFPYIEKPGQGELF
ncbi:hypothetical protein [Streptomyces spiralis]|uniref:hypothetical protein n=1 Tax=Streptomyces spiralis TaxID=66376 RepID=UPI003696463A